MPYCPNCGIDNPASARYCDQCGAMLIPVAAQPPAASPTAPAAPPTIPAPAALPPTPAPAPAAAPIIAGPTMCPQCGTAAIPGEAFCDNCGAPLSAPARPATPAPTYSAGLPPQPVYPPPQPADATPPPIFHQTPQPLPPLPPLQPPTLPPSAAPARQQTQPLPTAQPAAPPRTTLAPARLVVAATGAAIALPAAAQATIGRADAVSKFFPDIDLTPHGALDLGVGRRHARMYVQAGQIVIEDQDSTNGTLLNGQKLTPRQPQPLRDGDQVQFGKLLVRFQV